MNTATPNTWPVLAILLGSLLILVVYVIAAVTGWIDCAAWLPMAVSVQALPN